MALPQAKFREIVFQLLFCHAYSKVCDEEMVPMLMQEHAITRRTVREAVQRVECILSKKQEIDKMIAETSRSYAFQRIQSIELNILRLGVFELTYDDSIPPLVVISEAMRLAKKFSTPESSLFVNAILDNIYKSMQGKKIDYEAIEKSVALMEQNEAQLLQLNNDSIAIS